MVQVGPKDLDLGSITTTTTTTKAHLPKPSAPLTPEQFSGLPVPVKKALIKWALEWDEVYKDYQTR